LSPADGSKNVLKGFAAIVATAGLVVGKKLYDGPVFDERVSLLGKSVVITVNSDTFFGNAYTSKQ
jgi:hypothetical protein